MIRYLHSLYRRTERFKQWYNTRFTQLGKIVLVVLFISFFFGLNTQRSMIYQIFVTSFSAILFSFLYSSRFSTSLRIQRALPDSCVVGQPLVYPLEIVNEGKRTEKGLYFREAVEEYIPDLLEFTSAREDGEHNRNLFDRKMLYYRWLWLMRIGRRFIVEEHELPELQPGKKVSAEVSLSPLIRGVAHLYGYAVIKIDPLGLCKKTCIIKNRANVLILPRLYEMKPFLFQGSRKYHQGGIAMAKERGDSNEFLSLREYMPGDPVKHIDWKATARSEQITVKQYRDEYFSRYGLVLDSFTSLRFSEVFEEAVSIAASVIFKQDDENSVLDLLFVGGECVISSLGGGLDSKQRMLETLASISTCRNRPFSEMTTLVQAHTPLLSGVVVILIDWDDEREKLLNFLAEGKIPTQVIRVVTEKENVEDKSDIFSGFPVTVIEKGNVQHQLSVL